MAQAAPAIMAVSAVLGAATAGYSAYEQHQAAGEAEDIAKKNAQLAQQQADEEARRVAKTQARELALAKAKAAASGVDITSGSLDAYLADLEDWQKDELDWIRKTGKLRVSATLDQGKLASQTAKTQAWGSLGEMFSYAPSIYESGRKAEWW